MAKAEYKKQLFHPQYDNYNVFGSLKNESLTLKDFDKNIRQVLSHPITKHLLDPNPFPKDLNKINSTRGVNYTNNLIGECGWILFSLKKHKSKIITFLNKKEDFDKSLLLCDFDTCEKILDDIESLLGQSIWLLESKFLLNEYHFDTEKNWEYLNVISSEIENPLISFIVESVSKRTEKSLSILRYTEYLSSKIDDIGFKPLEEYLRSRLNFNSLERLQYYPFHLSMESGFPVVDKYLRLVEILSVCIQDDEFRNANRFELISIIEKILEIAPNTSMKNSLSILKGAFFKYQNTNTILRIMDEYTKGNYSKCIYLCEIFLISNPIFIEIYETYIKSLIFEKRRFENKFNSEIVNTILEKLYIIFNREEGFLDALYDLFKLGTAFSSTQWGKQLNGLLNKISNSNNYQEFDYQYILYSRFNNPRLVYALTRENDIPTYIENFKKEFGIVLSFEINVMINNSNEIGISSSNELNENRKLIYIARALSNGGKFEELVAHLSGKLQEFDNLLTIEEGLRLLFNALLKLEKVKEALVLYVNFYIKNRNLVKSLAKEELLELIIKQNNKDLKELIELPIFFKISLNDTYSQYVAYDDYLNSIVCERPSDILLTNDIEAKKYVYFLDEVCSIDVMQYSIEFQDYEDIELERQNILRKLLNADPKNEHKYIKEITELTQNSDIRKIIQEVNKGRITVNIPQLRNIENQKLKEGYERFRRIVKFTEENKEAKAFDVSSTSLKEYFTNLIEDKRTKPTEILNDPAFISFKSLFYEIRDQFLLSKEYGLDGYLSTRIRHGTLENHIRSVFEKHNLIGEKNVDGEYEDIKYWDEKTSNTNTIQTTKLQSRLKEFSKKIDDFIGFINQELIQVNIGKSGQKPNALFNYNFTSDFLWLSFKHLNVSTSNHEEFVTSVFKELQDYTEYILKNVRDVFNTRIKEHFLNELNLLQDEVVDICSNKGLFELNTAILNSRTDVINELDKISEWFYLSNPTSNMISSILTTLKTSVEIQNSIYPNHQIDAKYSINNDIPLVGAIHIIYISRILLDNIIRHSKLNTNRISVDISSRIIESQHLRLGFGHYIAKEVDTNNLKNVLDDIKEKWKEKANVDKSNIEGGSGFDKIRRILAFDIKGNNYSFDYELRDNYLVIFVDIDVKFSTYE